MDLPATFNVATHFVDRNVSQGRAQRIAIESADEQVTYQQLLDRTNRAGNALRQLGVRIEERVLLLLPDIPEFLYCFFGAIKIGAVAVPVSTSAKVDEYEHMLVDSRAGVAIVHETFLPLIEQIPRERMLGVVLNRAQIKTDNSYYYYSDRQRAAAAAQATEPDDEAPEMIYIEEDGVS